VTGARLALESGRGRSAVPARSTLVSAAVAVATVVAAITFGAGLDHLLETPSLYGWNWDVMIGVVPDRTTELTRDADTISERLAADDDVEGWSLASPSRVVLDGASIPAVGFDEVAGDVPPTLVSGRVPTDGEIALGGRTLDRLGVAEGDTVTATFGDTEERLRVVGRVVLPAFGTYSGSDKTELGAGAVLTQSDLRRLAPKFANLNFLVRLRPGSDQQAALARYTRGFESANVVGTGIQRPADVVNYDRVRTTPLLLAAVLALLVLATVGHALVASVRRRRRDLAVLETLGFTRRQVSATVAWQATTVAAIALLIGLPLGVVAGRLSWRLLAESLGTVAVPVTPILAVVLAVPVVLVLANLIAFVPGRMAARLKPAAVLRSE
jgi:ABC-type lipoprotein release transport system permease subunit